MPPKPPTQQMGEKHEEYLAEINAGRKSNASGSKWQDPGDGRSAHDLPYTFAWDGKSTHARSLTVTLDMISKIREQALGELPQIGLRWYATEDLTEVHEDWVAVPGDSWQDILASARAWVEIQTALGDVTPDRIKAVLLKAGMVDGLHRSLADAQQALIDAQNALEERDQALAEAALAGQEAGPSSPALPPELARFVPRLPWTVIQQDAPAERRGSAGDPVATAVSYDEHGVMTVRRVSSVRVERSAVNRPLLFVEKTRVRNGDLYRYDGCHLARVCDDDPSIEEE